MNCISNAVVAARKISKWALDELFADLKSAVADGGWMAGDHFKYEMFARRLVAAEYGRQDAVEWALEWHADLCKERSERLRVQQEQMAKREARLQQGRAELAAGRCGNQLYQAFLDTLEDPSLLKNNAPYFAFHSQMMAKFKEGGGRFKNGGEVETNDQGLTFLQFVRSYADQHLAKRLSDTDRLH